MKSRRVIWFGTLFAGVAAAYVGWLAYLAYFDLVTLDVRQMEVRTSQNPISEATLMYDYEKFHDDGRGVNVLYADSHVASLKSSGTVFTPPFP